MRIEIRARIHPSESPEKVMAAVNNVAPDIYGIEMRPDEVVCKAGVLTAERIVDTAIARRAFPVLIRLLERGKHKKGYDLLLNRQAAFVGRINLCENAEESPLGPIVMTFDSAYVEELILEYEKKGFNHKR
ncbi:MAG: hypothetical protein JRN19_05420 [Nitrososphaerota archaeon]|nr:hypothetical protein [Nitrososphaerota archaeon]MDG7049494.1 hypothetical protein [Nitrososphaerota archaeon]MDG7051874.1 hypothetical protein [Nitrososphaerota archaeon]